MFDDPITLVMVVTGFILVLASLALPRMMRKQVQAAENSMGQLKPAETAALERVEQSLLELEETSREVFGRIDTRTRVLIRLIEEAEVQAQRLEQVLRRENPQE